MFVAVSTGSDSAGIYIHRVTGCAGKLPRLNGRSGEAGRSFGLVFYKHRDGIGQCSGYICIVRGGRGNSESHDFIVEHHWVS